MSDAEEEYEDQADEDLDADALGDDDDITDLDDDLDADLDEGTRSELKAVEEELSQKEQNARSLAIRRALEERAEERRLQQDLDYLDD